MKSIDDLFRVIKTLSAPEKRYFKLYASRNIMQGKNNYLLLFDAIDEQFNYDEAALKERFRDETFSKYMASTKFELLNLLMRAMNAFHLGNRYSSSQDELVEFSEFLHMKGLSDLSLRYLKRVKKRAEENEDYSLILNTNGRMLSQLPDLSLKEKEKVLKEVSLSNIKETASLAAESLFFQRILIEIDRFLEDSQSYWSKPDPEKAKALYQTLFSAYPPPYLSTRSQYRLSLIKASIAFLEQDYQRVFVHLSNGLRIAEENVDLLKSQLEWIKFNTAFFSGVTENFADLKLIRASLKANSEENKYLSAAFLPEEDLEIIPEENDFDTRFHYFCNSLIEERSINKGLIESLHLKGVSDRFHPKILTIYWMKILYFYEKNDKAELRANIMRLLKYSRKHKSVHAGRETSKILETVIKDHPDFNSIQEDLSNLVNSEEFDEIFGLFNFIEWLSKRTKVEVPSQINTSLKRSFVRVLIQEKPFRLNLQ